MIRLILKDPEIIHSEEVLDFRKEFFDNDEFEIVGGALLDQIEEYALWLDYANAQANRDIDNIDYIPGDVYLVYDKYTSRLVGVLNLKDKFENSNDFYKGQVFYSVRPSLRNNNYGQEILAMAIEKMQEKNERMIISIPKYNSKFEKIVERYDGIFLRDEIIDNQNIISIYMFMF